jgi:hypothetical protein
VEGGAGAKAERRGGTEEEGRRGAKEIEIEVQSELKK